MRPHVLVIVIVTIAACALIAGCPSATEGSAKPAAAPSASARAPSPVGAASASGSPSVATPPSSSAVASASVVASSAPVKGPVCEAILAAPEGADPLCNEHVFANGAEIHWRSFATKETRAALNLRYLERSRGCGLGVVTKPPLFDLRDGERRHLETYEAGEGGYPQCEKKPTSAHRTVIVISEMTRR